MKNNVAGQAIGCQLINKTDGTPVTTGTTTVYVTGDAGTQAVGSVGAGACTHEGNGYWTYAPAQAETNYSLVAFTFVNASACNVTVQIYTTFPQTGDSYARLGAPAFTSTADDIAHVHTDTASLLSQLAIVAGYIDTEVAAILAAVAAVKSKTDNLPPAPAAAGDAMTLTAEERTAIAAAQAIYQITESYRATNAAPTLAQAICEILAHLGEMGIVGTTKTLKKFDGTTSSGKTFTLNDATNPTSITETT